MHLWWVAALQKRSMRRQKRWTRLECLRVTRKSFHAFVELEEKCTKSGECFVQTDPESVECRNGFCRCKFEYSSDKNQNRCRPREKSKTRDSNSKALPNRFQNFHFRFFQKHQPAESGHLNVDCIGSCDNRIGFERRLLPLVPSVNIEKSNKLASNYDIPPLHLPPQSIFSTSHEAHHKLPQITSLTLRFVKIIAMMIYWLSLSVPKCDLWWGNKTKSKFELLIFRFHTQKLSEHSFWVQKSLKKFIVIFMQILWIRKNEHQKSLAVVAGAFWNSVAITEAYNYPAKYL